MGLPNVIMINDSEHCEFLGRIPWAGRTLGPGLIKLMRSCCLTYKPVCLGPIVMFCYYCFIITLGPSKVSHCQSRHWHNVAWVYWAIFGFPLVTWASYRHPLMELVQHIGNRPATNIEPIIGITLAHYLFKHYCLRKNSRARKQQNDIEIH